MFYVLCISFGFALGSTYSRIKVDEQKKSIFKRSDS